VLVADCAPVVLWDPVRRVLAAAHAGRLGAIDDVIAPTIAAMIRGFGTDVRDVLAGVGPCVAAAGYEIGPREVAHARAAMGVSAPLSPTREGHATFDLAGAVVTRLRDAGVAPAHIELAGVDTRSSPDFFSDREARPCGRFALVASIRPA
jgi:copper oxidase (laccase) domain-containing protein